MKLPHCDDIKLISIDIYDTLILRAVAKPEDLFSIVWERATTQGLNKMEMTPAEYQKFRVEMERRARNGVASREVSLKDIYAQFPDFITDCPEKLQQLEIECEKEYSYSNYDLLPWLMEAKKRNIILVLVSDMYLSSTTIKSIIENAGIDFSLFDDILVSNEYLCNKQNGALFSKLFEKYSNIKPEQMLHIGDNKNSDFTQPLLLGMKAFHYDAINERMYSIFDYEKILHNIPQKELLALRKISLSNCPEQYKEKEKTAYELGSSVIGPVLSLYAAWTCIRMKASGIQRIYPLMREGYLLGTLLEREMEDQNLDFQVHPIYISRKVTYVPSIREINKEEIENMIGARNLTIRESIALMGLDEENLKEFSDYFDIRYKETHKIEFKGGTLKDVVITAFLRKENAERIEQYVKKERKKLVQYLQQEIGDLNKVATIDIGFFGRIQMWMEECLKLEHIPFDMKHFLAIGVTGDKVYNGINFEGMFGTFSENSNLISIIHRTTDVIEKLISVPEGSTIGYQETDGRIVPVQGPGVDNKRLTELCFEGVMDFQRLWMQFRRSKPAIAEACIAHKRETLMILHRLLDMPRKSEVEMLSGLEADTNFGTNYKKGIITREHIKLAEEKGVDFIHQCNVSYTYQNSNITWPKGVVTLIDEFYYVRRALKNSTANEIIRSMQEVVQRVSDDGAEKVALYGAGENGRQFYFLCSLYHIHVTCFIDRKESLWGTRKEGIPVMSLSEAMERGNDTYIVTSLFSISEISDYIKEKYAEIEKTPIIYSV